VTAKIHPCPEIWNIRKEKTYATEGTKTCFDIYNGTTFLFFETEILRNSIAEK